MFKFLRRKRTESPASPQKTVLAQDAASARSEGTLQAEQLLQRLEWTVLKRLDASLASSDKSALRKVLEVPLTLAARPTRLVALIKPQFEVGRGEVGKGGVVRDAALHERVCREVQDWLEGEGWAVQGITTSPITGPEGNVEFLISALHAGSLDAGAEVA
jgi:predicted rRNA methylase YqxC with S4 and FtsJ domains